MNQPIATVRKKHSTLHLLILALLSCVAALSFRKSAGIWMMIPVYPLCVAAASFLSVKRWQRGVFFLALIAILNLVENERQIEILRIVGMALLTFLFIELAVWSMRKKKIAICLCGVVLIAGCLCANALLFGDPFSAFHAQKQLTEYIRQQYDMENGGHTFGNVRFDTDSKLYTLTAYNDIYPTETGEIFLCGGYVVDHYRELLEKQQMQEPATELTNILREAFPSDSFTVVCLGISKYPTNGQKLSAHDTTDYSSQISYCIQLSGKPNYEKLITAAKKYLDVLTDSGLSYGDLTFTSSVGTLYRLSVTPSNLSGRYYESFTSGVYVLRHPEQYLFLEQNGLLAFIDRTVQS